MVDVRGFRAGDGPALVRAWRRGMPRDPITVERFTGLVLADANFDPEGLRVAVEGDEIVGCAYAVRRRVAMVGDDLEPDTGWIPFFFVDPGARRKGVGRAVLTSALAWLADAGARQAMFAAYTPNYILPGLDAAAYPEAAALMESLGFTVASEAAAMDRSLVDYAFPDEIRDRVGAREAEGYTFGTPSFDELPDLVRLAGEHFNPDWARAIRECVAGGLPLDRIVVAREPDGTIVGWAMHAAYEGMIERFGPFGVLADRRGAGLGRILLHLTLERMRALGAHGAWFLWTGEQSPAGKLYLSTGFATTRTFRVLRADLNAQPAQTGGDRR